MVVERKARKTLLIGWDAADRKVIHPLLDAGIMANLAALFPDLSTILWNSIATGKRPFNHGILGFTGPDPHGTGIRPITNLSRKTKAIWNILYQNSLRYNFIDIESDQANNLIIHRKIYFTNRIS